MILSPHMETYDVELGEPVIAGCTTYIKDMQEMAYRSRANRGCCNLLHLLQESCAKVLLYI